MTTPQGVNCAIDVVPVDPLDLAQQDLVAAWYAVYEATCRDSYGEWYTAWSQHEVQVQYRNQDHEQRLAWAARLNGDVVGHAKLVLPTADNTHRAKLEVAVHPDYRRLGVGSALLAVLERRAREHGRTVLVSNSDVLISRTDPAADFATRRGYSRGQINLRSDLVLPAPDEALPDAGPDDPGYEVLTEWGELPTAWLEDRVRLSRRMSTDPPRGDVDYREERWDTDRLRRTRAIMLEQGRRVVESVARHKASGSLVAFTTLVIPPHRPDIALQWETLVLPEHRGHRLGLRIKAANLRAVVAALPDVRRVLTWNAGENEPMLRVNRALGFQVTGRLTEWQKSIT